MPSNDFINYLEEQGQHQFGLCMFSPAIMAPMANRLLNTAYGDSGDNLSITMCRIDADNSVQYRAGNYSYADLKTTRQTIEVMEHIPGAVMMITMGGVGALTAQTLGIVEHGQTKKFSNHTHSFFSFASEHLAVYAVEHQSNNIEEFSDFGITIQAQILTPNSTSQLLLRTPWEAIFQEVIQDRNRLFRFKEDPRAFEEFIAETYRLDGYEVELTPRSNDGGVDVIARKRGFGAIKILDQAKAYSKERRVSANDVRAAYGVLGMTQDASKVVITTTSEFAPGVYKEFDRFMPTRLELRHGQNLIDWLKNIDTNRQR